MPFFFTIITKRTRVIIYWRICKAESLNLRVDLKRTEEKSHKKIAKEWQSVQTQGPIHKQTRINNTRSIKYSNIEQKEKKNGRRREGWRKNIKFTRLLSKIVEAAINPSDQLTRDRWQGVKIKEKNEAERVERKQRRGEEVAERNEYSSIYFMARIA